MKPFVAVDFETANSHRASACQMGISVFIDGMPGAGAEVFIRPPEELGEFDDFNIGLHGITPEMVEAEDTFDRVLPVAIKSIRGVPVVAHNAGFDMSVIRKGCEFFDIPYPKVDYFCTLVMARKSFGGHPGLLSFKLQSLLDYLEIPWQQDHRAGSDARAAGLLAVEMMKRQGVESLMDLAQDLQVVPGRLGPGEDDRCASTDSRRPPVTREELARRATVLRQFVGIQEWDPSGDFDGKSVKLTGSFVRLKKDYEAALVECNATVQNTVTKKTHFVVEGAQTSAEIAAGGSKASKEAIRLKAAGQNIEILDEADLLDLLAR